MLLFQAISPIQAVPVQKAGWAFIVRSVPIDWKLLVIRILSLSVQSSEFHLWITKKEKPEPTAVDKDIPSKGNPFRRRRRRRGTNLVPNQRKRSGSPIANMSGNDGIMNHHHDLEQEGKPDFDELDDFIDNPSYDKSQIQSEELV